MTAYRTADDVPITVRRIRDAEEGVWRRIGDSDDFMPEFTGGNMTLAEIVDHFGAITEVDE